MLTAVTMLTMFMLDVVMTWLGKRGSQTLWIIHAALPVITALILWSFSYLQLRSRPAGCHAHRRGALRGGLARHDGVASRISSQFSRFTAPLQALVILVAAAYTLVTRLRKSSTPAAAPWFWISIGWLLYFGSGVVLDPVSDMLLASNSMEYSAGDVLREGRHQYPGIRTLDPGGSVRTVVPEIWWVYLAAAGTVTIVVVAFVIAVMLQQRRHMASVRAFSDRLLAAQEEERALVAREIHDDVLQRVAVLLGELDGKRTAPPPNREAYARWVGQLREEVADLADDIRNIAQRMHPAVLDHLGLEAALEALAQDMTGTDGVQLDVNIDMKHKTTVLPKALTTSLYRIAQEALRNVAQHAQVNRASLSMTEQDGGIRLVVEDQGRGLPEDWERGAGGLGITSMKERARLVNGQVSVMPARDRGTRVEAWVPLQRRP